jgi:predicted nucleic acid-binding protein
MIVVDTNVISYLLLPTPYTSAAERLFQSDCDWAAPVLWRSEMRNVLALYLRKDLLRMDQDLMKGNEYQVTSTAVLSLAAHSGCSAYDCEFVSLARDLGTLLVTADEALVSSFPDQARPLAGFV